MANVAIYAGSFDPFTKGHMSVLREALKSFDKVVVGIGVNRSKGTMFTTTEREEIVKQYLTDLLPRAQEKIFVDSFRGLLVNFCLTVLNNPLVPGYANTIPSSVSIIRGLRAISDFENEMAIANANLRLNPRFGTLFIPTDAGQAFISSSLVKEIASHLTLEDTVLLSPYVIPSVGRMLVERLSRTK